MPTDAEGSPLCLACGGRELTPWARSRDVEYLSIPDTFAYHRCVACGSLSIFPVPAARLSEIYPSTYYSFDVAAKASLVTRVKLALDRRLFRSLFRRVRQRGALAALDVGGGTGWLLDEARRTEPRLQQTVVVDIDAGAREVALAAGHGYFLGRIEDFATDDRFDVVLMLNLIEHVQDPVGVLANAAHLLAPDGLILVKTPNYDSLDARIFRHRDWGGYHCPRHWVLFSAASFRATAERAGLRVEDLRHTQGAPFWAISVMHWMQQRGWIDVSRTRPMPRHPMFPLLLAVFAALDFIRGPFMRTSQMFVVLRKA